MPPESDVLVDVQIFRYHVDLATKRCVVEFRVRNPETGALEPPIGHARHSLPLNEEVVTLLEKDVGALLQRDLSELPPPLVRSHAVTSELHHLREIRHAQAEAVKAESEARSKMLELAAASERALDEKVIAETAVTDLTKQARLLEARVSALRAETAAIEAASKARGGR